MHAQRESARYGKYRRRKGEERGGQSRGSSRRKESSVKRSDRNENRRNEATRVTMMVSKEKTIYQKITSHKNNSNTYYTNVVLYTPQCVVIIRIQHLSEVSAPC